MNTEPLLLILAAKEERAALRRQYAAKGQITVSLNLNVPGYPKINLSTDRFFKLCLNQFKTYLLANRIFISEKDTVHLNHAAGEFFISTVSAHEPNAWFIKETCERFEETHPEGRFIDADVYDMDGKPVSSGKSKSCFFCRIRPAIECRRDNTHETIILREYMFAAMDRYYTHERRQRIILRISSLAIDAVLQEVALTPKPGLVDKLNQGSHEDMDFNTFIRSTAAIAPYFQELLREGFQFQDADLSHALPVIRKTGLEMENAMFKSTGGVNTQKGLVFLMGISLFACGYWYRDHQLFDQEEFSSIVSRICAEILLEFREENPSDATHGKAVYSKYRQGGIRKEAAEGLPLVFRYGLPELLKHEKLNNKALMQAFLSIASHNTDTTILFRAGNEALETFRLLATTAFLSKKKADFTALENYCLRMHISPGGSADLLAVSIFIFYISRETFY